MHGIHSVKITLAIINELGFSSLKYEA